MPFVDIHLSGMSAWLQRQPQSLFARRISDPEGAARDVQEAAEDLAALGVPRSTPEPDRGVPNLAMHDPDAKCAVQAATCSSSDSQLGIGSVDQSSVTSSTPQGKAAFSSPSSISGLLLRPRCRHGNPCRMRLLIHNGASDRLCK